jgi:hypothetical protein
VSTVEQIEAAIRALPASERERLISDLPRLFPEVDGDAFWECIINEQRPRAALSRLLDQVEAAVNEDPAQFPETTDDEFKRRS